MDERSLADPDPAVGLRAVVALQRLSERMEAIQVANARRQGWSWARIAEALGAEFRNPIYVPELTDTAPEKLR